MRKKQKQQAEELIVQMEQAHDQIRKYLERKKDFSAEQSAMQLLEDCQSGGISLGTLIESTEGEGHPTVTLLEEYCELVYGLHEELADGKEKNANKIYKPLRQKLVKISNSLKNDVRVRVEAVFLPYKASMWDSLESVWQAADADPDCDAYVIPIPYFDKNPDGSLGQAYYEADQYPDNVPITKYDEFDFGIHQPDMIYIHNPYDNINYVTSVHPFFYSDNLKKFTECLVYIPYFATAGGMNAGQSWCPGYVNADYIVIQAEKYRKYYDADISDEKFLAFGSPKFDSVIHKCQNPPEPPAEWKEKMQGRKVYFYNTSISGMLGNTEAFLKKMNYVFEIFRGREDACLLWRPHPLLESTFDSMRASYKPVYDALKTLFITGNIGILDETPDMENTIALSDVYIGDAGTSVISLFGVVGKPIFILNNYLHSLPGKDDWRGERISLQFNGSGDDRYQVTNNNQLWFSEKNDYHYKFYMDLETGYSGSRYYTKAMEIKGKIYVIPYNAQNMLIIEDKRIRKIEFTKYVVQGAAFLNGWYDGDCKYLFLYPNQYPQLIRYHLDTGKIDCIDGIQPFYVRMVENEWQTGGIGLYGNELMFASPEDSQILFMDIDTLETRRCSVNSRSNFGIQSFALNGEDLWLMPVKGMTITRWNPKTGEVREYSDVPECYKVTKWPFEYECKDHPFGNIAFFEEEGRKAAIISPGGGNMYLSLDKETGRMEEWKLPMGSANRGKNEYFLTAGMGGFAITRERAGKPDSRIWYAPERKLYDINVFTKEYSEVTIEFDYDDLLEHEPGFTEESEWLQYCLNENAFNSLKDLLDDKITGNRFDRERQLRAFSNINANTDGTCGRNVYDFVKKRLLR
ncbi:MAG: hypothetical protein NC341_04180 [Blautia sp.]|nr:hypothetical protein [Blautia sp.]MCM1200796.1 hypothetical protein [Bacteroides fragilis]